MPEPNENQTTQLPKQEICTIRIAFPVESDDQAITYKKKIAEILSDIPDVAIQFTIMSRPTGGSANAGMGGL